MITHADTAVKQPTLVLNVVGLCPAYLGPHTPSLSKLEAEGVCRPLRTVTPAVTCSVQATFLTGLSVEDHGIVGNGWYFRDTSEVRFWCQSNRLIQGEQIWQAAKRQDANFRGANLFWWFNMYSEASIGVTPRPMYPADGRKIPDIYTEPPELRHVLQADLGRFPLFNFWGPTASIASSKWIAQCTNKLLRSSKPDLAMVYLPHLDYDTQRYGPRSPQAFAALREVDALVGELVDEAKKCGYAVVVLSEYGLTEVRRGIEINRVLRRAGLLRVREELGRELLDAGASEAFAVADHQIAHVYVRRSERIEEVKQLVASIDGVEGVFDRSEQRTYQLAHARSGELVALARSDRWFCYYYWLDDDRAPDFARCVDIHRKPGYDPVELFLDPAIPFPRLKVARKLLAKKLGQRVLMDLIPIDTDQVHGLVKGSHGRPTDELVDGPILISSDPAFDLPEVVEATEVKSILLEHVYGAQIARRLSPPHVQLGH